MFGLSFEKIVIAVIIAVIILGPSRLPYYAHQLGGLVRLFRAQIDIARECAAESLGEGDWQTLDPRQYDPRRIIREAMEEPTPARSSETATPPRGVDTATTSPGIKAATAGAEVPGRYIVTGSSGHPRRQFVAHTTESRVGDEGSTSGQSTVGQ